MEVNHSKPHPKRKKIDAARDAQFDVTAHSLGKVYEELDNLRIVIKELEQQAQRAQAQIVNLGEEMIRTKKSL